MVPTSRRSYDLLYILPYLLAADHGIEISHITQATYIISATLYGLDGETLWNM